MKAFFAGFIACLIGGVTATVAIEYHRVHVTKEVRDSRGLISVQYTQDGKEYAEDYLTETEYLKLINE